jgi:hypothetical protein
MHVAASGLTLQAQWKVAILYLQVSSQLTASSWTFSFVGNTPLHI